MFRNTKLSTRLVFGFGTILVLLAVIVVVAIISLNNAQSSMTNIVDVNVYKLNLCQDMTNCIWRIKDSVNEMVISKDPATREELKKNIDAQRETYNAKSAELDKTAVAEAGLELRKRIKDNVQAARPLINKVIELANSNNTEEAARVLREEADPAIDKELASLEEGVQMQNENNESEAENEKASNKASYILITILGVVAIVAGVAIAAIIIRSITKPVKDIVINLTEGAHQVASAAGQLSATSQQLAEGNSEQAASIEETSATLEEASSMISQNAENTNQAALLAAQTKTSSDKGNADMMEMMNSMVEIKKSSDQIAKIIKVIDDIAFQTNILALNAAVEAARAGDAGMGFAVVAEEVRNLAQRSAQAAKDTASIIESNISLSENGVSVAKKVGESLAEITVQAKKVNELMDEIAAAGREQSQGISQINKAISQMEAVTQQNAANAEESASASEELSAQAEVLRGIVHRLVVLVDGNSSGTDASVRPASGGTSVRKSGYPAARVQSRKISSVGNESKKTASINPEEVIPLSEDLGNF